MSCDPPRLTRTAVGRPAPPVRAVHLGLGSFFRAHQASYTADAPDAAQWGYAAFAGRSAGLAPALRAQDGLYTLLVRAPDGARASVMTALAATYPADDADAWLRHLAAPTTALLTITVTEAAYRRRADGGLDLTAADVAADLAALQERRLDACRTVPGRIVAGLQARRHADAGPIAVVPADNLLHNGAAVRRVVTELATAAEPALAEWIETSVSFVDSEVDRITPRTTADDVATAQRLTGWHDAAPVVTEPFREWVLAGAFPAGRPAWEYAGARMVDDVEPFEQRKLWLLNGAHSLLAYAGSIRGHRTVAEAIASPECRAWVEEWWDEAARHLSLPGEELVAYREDLLVRFANPGIEHLLAQIATDGSQKLPVRVLPVLRAERAAGRSGGSALRCLGAWVGHVRGHGAPLSDPLAGELVAAARGPLSEATPRLLAALDPALADDPEIVAAVTIHTEELTRADH